jgi:hypothetical protein
VCRPFEGFHVTTDLAEAGPTLASVVNFDISTYEFFGNDHNVGPLVRETLLTGRDCKS